MAADIHTLPTKAGLCRVHRVGLGWEHRLLTAMKTILLPLAGLAQRLMRFPTGTSMHTTTRARRRQDVHPQPQMYRMAASTPVTRITPGTPGMLGILGLAITIMMATYMGR